MKYIFVSFLFILLDYSYTYEVVNRCIDKYEEMPRKVLSCLDSMGVTESTTLNKYEIKFFEAAFGNNLKDYDFHNKKIGFIEGVLGKTSNELYFKNVKENIDAGLGL